MRVRTDIIPVRFDDGTIVKIEATVLGGTEDVAALKRGLPFEELAKPIQKILGGMARIINEVQPDKASVQLGFEIATSEGHLTALLVKGAATANVSITLEWSKTQNTSRAHKSRKI